jgi:hypothetical protein
MGPREALKDVTGLGQDGDYPPAPSEGAFRGTSDTDPQGGLVVLTSQMPLEM